MPVISDSEILFILNPNSGRKKTEEFLNKLHMIAPDIKAVTTHDLEAMKHTFRENIDRCKVIAIFGGDGTVNKTIKYLKGLDDKILAVYPAGSGNGFARELGFTKSLENLLEKIKSGNSVSVDILKINGKNCINVAGLGFDSYVAHQFQKSKGRGLKNYILATVKSVFSFNPFYAEITIEDKRIEGTFQMISIANTRQFGNNAIISPGSDPADGMYELVLVKPFPFWKYPLFVWKMFRGTLTQSKYITFLKTRGTIEIASAFNQYHIDGEPKIFSNTLKIKLARKKIRVLRTS